MISPTHPVERRGNVAPFTAIAWLLWSLIPAVAWGTMVGLTNYEMVQPENGGPGGAIGIAILGFLLMFALVPVVATLQWLLLRRTWPNVWWLWPAWLLNIIVSLVTVFVFLPKNVPIAVVVMIGLAPAIVLGLASPKSLRLSTFGAILLSFLGGAALAWVIQQYWWTVSPLSLVSHLLPYELLPEILIYHFLDVSRFLALEVSLLLGAAVSGFGLWLVSRRISRRKAGLAPADGGSA
jgi:hypothetical protein